MDEVPSDLLGSDGSGIWWRRLTIVWIFTFLLWKIQKKQTGDASDRPWHVYSNPNSPHICPVLDLAKYLLTHPDLLQEGSPLFPGNSQYERFVKKFTKLFSKTKKSLINWEWNLVTLGHILREKVQLLLCVMDVLCLLQCHRFAYRHFGVWEMWKIGIYTTKKLGISFVVEVSAGFHLYVRNLLYPQHILN